jgi:hypothetical protein
MPNSPIAADEVVEAFASVSVVALSLIVLARIILF